MHKPVNKSDTKRGGRFSGSRNWWMISGRDVLIGMLLDTVNNSLFSDERW